jgi:spore coat protein U-like protein
MSLPGRVPAAAFATALLLCGVAAGPAVAATTCTVAATPVNFGVYDPLLATPDDTTGTITVTCTNRPPPGNVDLVYLLRLSRGLSDTFRPRQMAAGAERLDYNLYLNAGRSLIWGDGTQFTLFLPGSMRLTGNRTFTQTHTIYARMPARQDAQIGSYVDTIVVTLEF